MSTPPQNKKRFWIAFFVLWALHGSLALWQWLGFPADEGGGMFYGLAARRLFGTGVLCLWILLSLTLALVTARDHRWSKIWLDADGRARFWDAVFIIALILVSGSQGTAAVLGGLSKGSEIKTYAVYAERLSPFLDLATLIPLELMGVIVFSRRHILSGRWKTFHPFLRKCLWTWGILGTAAAVIAVTGLGIVPTRTGDWSRGLPAVPLLEWQILLACLFCIGTVIAEARMNLSPYRRLDLWVSLALWLGTVVLWTSQPVIPNASALKPQGPNFEVYPFIDAQVYDEYAQSALVGNGFKGGEIPQRPLYIVFLIFMHVLVGQDYNRMIALQSLFLAVFPVLLYLFGREFFGRPVGIAVALLAALRDYTSNLAAPFTGNLSYSKVYLSEIPTAILLILFLLITLRWIRLSFPAFLGLAMGGVLGTAMLIRTQAIVALPVTALIALFVQPRRLGALTRSVLLMIFGVALVIAPWLWRNWRITGELIFDNPASQTINLALRYSRLNGIEADVARAPGESNTDYNDRLVKIASDAIRANPAEAAKGVVNHFLNHGVDNILLFPLRNDLLDLSELWRPSRAYWEMWEGQPTASQSLALAFYVFLFGLGVAAAWHRNGWLGFLPLGVNLAYNLWTSLSLLSGQRFLLTMDWSIYLYYMIGIFALLSALFFALESGRSIIVRWYENNLNLPAPPPARRNWQHSLAAVMSFFLIGASLPLSERVFPQRYPPQTQDEILSAFTASVSFRESGISPACLEETIRAHQLSLQRGRAISPRYYPAGDGERFTDKFGYKVSDEARMVFYLVGQGYGLVILPVSTMPGFFPNASDVIVARGDRAWFVIVRQGKTERLYVSDLFDPSTCR